jgi:hypothetical protein
MPTINDARDTYGSSLAFVAGRTELAHVLARRGLFGCGVEVGVQQAHFSEFILRTWPGSLLVSVDPWREDAPDGCRDIANVPQQQQERLYAEACQRLAAFGKRSQIWRTTSLEAAERFVDATLDFVYLDARHDYAAVMEDLRAWAPKVRPGGILAGHDYLDGVYTAGDFGVKSAVDEFGRANGLTPYATHLDGPCVSWLIAMPRPDASAVVTDDVPYAPPLAPATPATRVNAVKVNVPLVTVSAVQR